MNAIDQAKLAAARAALAELPESGIVGLGSGSTAKLFIDEVGRLVRDGRKLLGVPTSEGSREQAAALGIPLMDDAGPWAIDVNVDGADEVSDALDLIKGGGGALTREKIVNNAARRNVIIVDGSKRSAKLGEKWPIPIEVLNFGRASTARALEKHGDVRVRVRKDGETFRTDAGNYIYDLHVGPIGDPRELEVQLLSIPGVVEVGLFVQRADLVLIATEQGVQKLVR